MRLTNREVGSGCLVLSLAGSFGLQWSLWPPSKTQEGIETRSNPNKAEAWQEVAMGWYGSSHALGLGRSLRGVSSLSLPSLFLWTHLNPHC